MYGGFDGGVAERQGEILKRWIRQEKQGRFLKRLTEGR